MKRNKIELTAEQRIELKDFSTKGVHSVRLVNRAKIILLLDTSGNRKALSQGEIAERINVCRKTVNEVKRDFIAAESVDAFLQRKKRDAPPVEPKITGDVEARIIALACGAVPEGYAKWSLQLLADKSVELNYIDSISDMSVHRLLKKHSLSLT
jgi:predicted XRE-type DNA-binding protein